MIRRWQPLACLALVAGTTSCIDLSVDPAEVASIEFVAPANPSLVRGDTLVDTLGRADRLVARVYTADGDLVADAPVYFVATDTLVKVVNRNKIVAADTTGTSKVYAVSGQLQSIARSLSIIRRPDSIAFNGTGPDTLRLRPPTAGTAIDTSKSVAVTVRAGTGSATPVRVKFELLRRGVVLAPGDTGTYALVSSGARISTVDTTDGSGIASRIVRVRTATGASVTDTLVVRATVTMGGALKDKPALRTVLILPAP